MIAALYARVSTGEQTAEPQLLGMQRYCDARGWEMGGEFVDQANGASTNRPQLDELMRPETLRKFDVVLVWKFDRLFRSVPHMIDALQTFRGWKVGFVSVTENIDTTTPVGRFTYTLLAAMAEFERDLIRERTRAGMARAAAAGKQIGRPRVNIDPVEAAKMQQSGCSLAVIAEKYGCSRSVAFSAVHEGVLKLSTAISKQQGKDSEK